MHARRPHRRNGTPAAPYMLLYQDADSYGQRPWTVIEQGGRDIVADSMQDTSGWRVPVNDGDVICVEHTTVSKTTRTMYGAWRGGVVKLPGTKSYWNYNKHASKFAARKSWPDVWNEYPYAMAMAFALRRVVSRERIVEAAMECAFATVDELKRDSDRHESEAFERLRIHPHGLTDGAGDGGRQLAFACLRAVRDGLADKNRMYRLQRYAVPVDTGMRSAVRAAIYTVHAALATESANNDSYTWAASAFMNCGDSADEIRRAISLREVMLGLIRNA